MEEREKLAKMDLLRARFDISYARAREVLEANDWDAVLATIQLEQEQATAQAAPGGFTEELKVSGRDLVETLKRILHEGNVTRIIVRDPKGIEILNLPVTGAVVFALILPVLTALGAVVILAMDYTVVVERKY
ncbi:hypothetical protein J2Z79_003382 [Symbiobacterium terraclitae]|uniref:DUF4342 domain-containing protein n=1 Tax=Symbiobacterium terraclitae TaxID=557451 RepID=A0ABS4JY91_9FIRM|nr:DUF4342 domain-containing protein [Symbiobacterium terraclitae]MBP2019935.1 hypothetical protein [Symbiobacterium terraclitae]